MSRITVEDCLEKVTNRFELVVLASKRARHLFKGAKPLKITDVVLTSYSEAAQKAYPEYFADLPPAR